MHELGMHCGVPEENCFVMNNGDVLAFNQHSSLAGRVPCGTVYTDKAVLVMSEQKLLRDRKILSEEGLVIVAVSIKRSERRLIKRTKRCFSWICLYERI